jgi:hypothetical protein
VTWVWDEEDAATEALLVGRGSSGDDAFDEVLGQLRVAGRLGAPVPRSDVAALIRTGWSTPVPPARRARMVAAAMVAAVLVFGGATAAASASVREPVGDTIGNVVDVVRHALTDKAAHVERPESHEHRPSLPSPVRSATRAAQFHARSLPRATHRSRHAEYAGTAGRHEGQLERDALRGAPPQREHDARQGDEQSEDDGQREDDVHRAAILQREGDDQGDDQVQDQPGDDHHGDASRSALGGRQGDDGDDGGDSQQ